MRRWLNIIFMTVCSFSVFAEEYDLYLCIGQSNMAGRGKVTKNEEKLISNCFVLDDKAEWKVAQSPLNQFSTVRKEAMTQGVGPIYGFANAVVKAFPGKKVGLVVNARGGTKIQQWQPGEKLYEEAVNRCKKAQKSGKFKAVLWHQGEGNRNYAAYKEDLVKLVEALRKELNDPELPFIVGEIAGDAPVNDKLAEFAKEVPFTAIVSSEGLTMKDKSHFDTQGQLELGTRYAKALFEMKKK